jgi:hypothetical protein
MSAKPTIVKIRGEEFRKLAALDKNNWRWQNQWAQYCSDNKLKKEAKKAFRAIGGHWDEVVWPQNDFIAAKATALGSPTPAATKL